MQGLHLKVRNLPVGDLRIAFSNLRGNPNCLCLSCGIGVSRNPACLTPE